MSKFSFNRILLIVAALLVAIILAYFLIFRESKNEDLNTVDKNGNGIWDDYEAVIDVKFGKSQNIKNAALQMGKVFQEIFKDPTDAINKDRHFEKAATCLVAAGEHEGLSTQDAAELIGQVRDIVISNEVRQEKYIIYTGKLSGSVLEVGMPDLTNCEFKILESH